MFFFLEQQRDSLLAALLVHGLARPQSARESERSYTAHQASGVRTQVRPKQQRPSRFQEREHSQLKLCLLVIKQDRSGVGSLFGRCGSHGLLPGHLNRPAPNRRREPVRHCAHCVQLAQRARRHDSNTRAVRVHLSSARLLLCLL